MVVDDAIYNEIGSLLGERKEVDPEKRTELNNRIRNLMRARKKLENTYR